MMPSARNRMNPASTDRPPLTRRLAAESVGSFFLFATVIGSSRHMSGNIAFKFRAFGASLNMM